MRRCCPESCNTGKLTEADCNSFLFWWLNVHIRLIEMFFLFMLGQDYEPCFINTTKSCTERNNADTGKRMDYDACVAFCNQDPECKFIFHVPKNQDIPSGISCIKSRSCDETTKTNFVGSTYSREGDCPGIM